MARGDEVDDWADDCFTRLDGWWINVGRVKSVEEGCIPMTLSDIRLKALW